MYTSHRPDTNECTCSSCDMGPVGEDNEKDEKQTKPILDHLRLQFHLKGTNTTTERNYTLTGEQSSPTEEVTETLSECMVEGLKTLIKWRSYSQTKHVPWSAADWIVGLTLLSEFRVDWKEL